MSSLRKLLLGASLLASSGLAAVPGEIRPDMRLDAVAGSPATLSWTALVEATKYHVHRGTDPRAGDHACFLPDVATTSAGVPDPPPPGGLHYFLVSAANLDGEGPIGTRSDGLARANRWPCDSDGDTVPDAADNCPLAANVAQADQDEDGEGDRCDPQTYDFEGDAAGARPADTHAVGGMDPTFAVRDAGGDLVAAYSETLAGAHDVLERVEAAAPFQDTTIYLDVEMVPEVCSIELWSEGAYGWNAGSGLIVQVGPTGQIFFYPRIHRGVPQVPGPFIPATGRMRLRLARGSGSSSAIHVDAFDGSAWIDDVGRFDVPDDHRMRGLSTVLANYIGGRRGIRRITVNHSIPSGTLTLAKDARWSADWKVFQRDTSGTATIPVRAFCRADEPALLEAAVVASDTRLPLPGHDFADHALPVPAAALGRVANLELAGVPAGGNYDVEVRLRRERDGALLGGAFLSSVAVGDVFVAGGQSNMSGYSGGLAGGEVAVDDVHLFANDGLWRRATEPMDDGTDQVDAVSAETPAHSLMLRFAKDFARASGVPVGVIPGPLGGTNLFAQWQRDAADHGNRGTLYGSLIARTTRQGFETPPRGYLWFQGESDVIGSRGTALYRQDLERLVAQVREDLSDPALPFFIAQLGVFTSSDLDQWTAVQEAQRQVAAADPAAALVTTIDQPLADAIHFSVAGYQRIGARFAEAARELILGEPIDALVDVASARTGTGGSSIEITFEADLAGGGNPAMFRAYDAGGLPGIVSLSIAGNVVTLQLDRALVAPAEISYGYSRDPAGAWLRDARGTPVPLFSRMPVAP